MKIEKSTFKFLNELKKNNNRDWFAEHKSTYQSAHKNAKNVFDFINDKLQEHDEIDKSKMILVVKRFKEI